MNEVFVHEDTLVELILEGERITTTEDHPFWSVTDQRFERADELSPGEEVLDAAGHPVRVLQIGATSRTALAYNLSVRNLHTYHVGQSQVLVHNDCGPFKTRPFDRNGNKVEGGAPEWQAKELAHWLGYTKPVSGNHRSAVYSNGKQFITQDKTSHNGGFWKMGRTAEATQRKGTREGTFDFLLNRVGD